MSTPSTLLSRPDKGNYAETVLYEINMLRFTRELLLSPNAAWTASDQWVYLEGFLLHYRNLIEFFGKPNPNKDDLTIKRPDDFWKEKVPAKADIDSMTQPNLWEKYETRKNPESISKYLHHCTKQRIRKRKWDVRAMYEELRPAIEKFNSLLPQYKPATELLTRTRGASSFDGFSTTSIRTLGSLIPEK